MGGKQDGMFVRDAMTEEVATVGANDRLSLPDDIMRLGRVRHMPVVDDEGDLIGILSQRDLFRGALARSLGYGQHAQDKLLAQLMVKEVMSVEVATTTPDMPLHEAAATMMERKIGCLVVVEGTRPIGILTETDFVRLAVSP